MMHVKSVTCTNSSLYSCTKSIVTVGLYVCIIVSNVALSGQIRRVGTGFTGDWRPWAGCCWVYLLQIYSSKDNTGTCTVIARFIISSKCCELL